MLGEACHSSVGAWREARERYAEGCRLEPRVRAGELDPARVLDVGTGLGWNLAAALAAVEGAGGTLAAVGLERDATVVEAALALPPAPGEAGRWHGGALRALVRALATPGEPVPLGERSTLALWLGDARATLPALAADARFDAVFLDPFSPRVDPALWEPGFLAELGRRMAPGAWLSTYTASMGVRAGLVAAGLAVGPGAPLGAKREGTLARRDGPLEPFPQRTAAKLARRAARLAAADPPA